MALVVDRLRAADLPDALRLSTQAGWNQLEADWTRILDLSPEGCLAGRLEGRLVATATVASYGTAVHWIGMVLVDEAMRGRGFGSTMLSAVIEQARRRGGIVGLDATDLGRPVYLKQGFVDLAPIDRWQGILKSTRGGTPTHPMDASHLDDVVALDFASCGADRGPLLRHLFEEPGVKGLVTGADRLTGFAFLRPGRTRRHLGPMIALDDASRTGLLSEAAEVAQGSSVLVDVLRTPASTANFDAHGLSIVRRLTRMTLGDRHPVLTGEALAAAVAFEWG